MSGFNGLGMHLATCAPLQRQDALDQCGELYGREGKGGMATEGTGASRPAISVRAGRSARCNRPGETFELADIREPGAIQHIWMTPTGPWRFSILRIYWDDCETLGRVPRGRLLRLRVGQVRPGLLTPRVRQPRSAFNCYWEMPFRKRCRMTMTNLGDEAMTLYYQIDYTLTEVPDDVAYFHAQFRRVNPLPYKEVSHHPGWGEGPRPLCRNLHGLGVNNTGWWGEGEIKFYLDGDEYPTICGYGTEDYFCGSYNFENRETRQYQEFTTPYSGLPQVIRPDGSLPVAAAVWPLPVAHHGPDPLRARPAGDNPGAWVAQRRALPAFAGRHRVRRLLATRRCRPRPSRRCRTATIWRSSEGLAREDALAVSSQAAGSDRLRPADPRFLELPGESRAS